MPSVAESVPASAVETGSSYVISSTLPHAAHDKTRKNRPADFTRAAIAMQMPQRKSYEFERMANVGILHRDAPAKSLHNVAQHFAY